MNLIGHITLNVSLTVYLIWFVPQIILNFKRKDTEGLSILMFGILCFGYLTDLMYGFGRDMQWQYRLVTFTGLASLAIQHYQFGRYGLHRITEKYTYIILSFFYLLLLAYTIYVITGASHSKSFYDIAGMIANIAWFSYMLPQIFKNYFNKSTTGLSIYFVGLALFLNSCDFTSAWALGWDYPSKVGPAITFFGNSILLFQVIIYGRENKQRTRLVTDSKW